MKKLIIACAAVLVLGLGLTTVGHVLGGQFYSVYYNGALHPFSDAAQNFSDKFVNISDHLVTADDDDDSDFDTDWVQDYLGNPPECHRRFTACPSSRSTISPAST